MARTDISDVKKHVQTELDDSTINMLIEDAAFEVDDRLGNTDMSEQRLERIERYLAAHFVSIGPDRQIESGGSQSSSVTFTGEFGEGLKSTTFGQRAIELDTSGTLNSLSTPSASFHIPDDRGTE